MKQRLWIPSALLVIGVGPAWVTAAPPYLYHQRGKLACGVDGSRYGITGQPIASDRMLLVARPLPPATVNLGSSRGAAIESVAIKRFDAIPVTRLSAGPVTVDSIGVAIYANGDVVCTGIAHHDGGIQAAHHGGNIDVRVRLLMDVPESPHLVLIGRVLLESRRQYWVPRDRSVTIAPLTDARSTHRSLATIPSAPTETPQHALIARHFDEITHVEIEIDYLRDR